MSGIVSRSEQIRRAGRGSRQSMFVTRLALLYARLWRGTARFDDEFSLFVCTGLRGGFGRGGTTFGGAYLTKGNTARRVLRHEAVHADQWANFGLTFPFRYLAEEARHRGPANKYEIEAGLADGGYRQPG
ncbi:MULTISPECIES: hypothetical protein [Nocardiaceae]|uniref:hypothetical protein n=2 Tax=Mycobacteriales TaxID=85007 RepID=UPI00353019F9